MARPKKTVRKGEAIVRVNISMTEADRDRYQAEAQRLGRISLAAFARQSMDEKIERAKAKRVDAD
jgi:hypothetical protein